MPLEGQDYSNVIEGYIKSIEAMPVGQQSALKASYIFSRKAPREERQDLFQHLITHTLELMVTYPKSIRGGEDAWCYVVARHEWKRITRERKRHNRMLNGGFASLNKIVPSVHQDGDGCEVELQELLAGEAEFERKLNSKLDCQAVLNSLPKRVKAVVVKLLIGLHVSNADYKAAKYYTAKHEDSIREALKA